MMRLASLLMVSLMACTTGGLRTYRESQPRTQLFPAGIYKQAVTLVLKDKQSFAFSAVLRLSGNEIHLIALGPLGATIFKVTDDLRRPDGARVEAYMDSLKGQESRIRDYYKVIRRLLLAKLSVPPPTELISEAQGSRVVSTIRHYDVHQIADHIVIEHPDFLADVKVVGYEL